MTRSYRNNNPGNIEYGPIAKQWGAVPEKGVNPRFGWFATNLHGLAALNHVLAKNYINMTLEDAMLHYAPQSENNTEAYIQFLTGKVGVPRNTLLKDLDAIQAINLLLAITLFEGYKP
jgi:hypothetical protein